MLLANVIISQFDIYMLYYISFHLMVWPADLVYKFMLKPEICFLAEKVQNTLQKFLTYLEDKKLFSILCLI